MNPETLVDYVGPRSPVEPTLPLIPSRDSHHLNLINMRTLLG